MLKPNVLRRKKDFSAIYNKGKSVGERYVVLFCRKNGLPYNRTAFLASKKVGNAVKRNRARRLMKESYRDLGVDMDKGYDFIWIARNTIVNLKCADVKKSMEAASRKSGTLKKGRGQTGDRV
ncbi:MAG: ribonuclease [Bacillota bacterium]|jgi:ribonuclease P protein component|nr:ribonuclease [Bacillota bacterium]